MTEAKNKKKDNEDTTHSRGKALCEEEVLRRMLRSPPQPKAKKPPKRRQDSDSDA